MSFGCSISDVVGLGQLALKVVQSSRKACGEYDELTREVTALHAVLQRLGAEISRPQSPINRPGDSSGKELQVIAKDCRKVLRVLDIILDKFNALGEEQRRGRKLWQKIRFGNGEMNDLADLRSQVLFYTSAITFYLNIVNVGTLGRVEEQMSVTGGVLKEIQAAVNKITIQSVSESAHEGSILTTYSDDDKAVWKEFRRELIREGFSSSDLQRHKRIIQAYVKELSSRGLLDAEFAEYPDTAAEDVHAGVAIPQIRIILPSSDSNPVSNESIEEDGHTSELSHNAILEGDASSTSIQRRSSHGSVENEQSKCQKTAKESSSQPTSRDAATADDFKRDSIRSTRKNVNTSATNRKPRDKKQEVKIPLGNDESHIFSSMLKVAAAQRSNPNMLDILELHSERIEPPFPSSGSEKCTFCHAEIDIDCTMDDFTRAPCTCLPCGHFMCRFCRAKAYKSLRVFDFDTQLLPACKCGQHFIRDTWDMPSLTLTKMAAYNAKLKQILFGGRFQIFCHNAGCKHRILPSDITVECVPGRDWAHAIYGKCSECGAKTCCLCDEPVGYDTYTHPLCLTNKLVFRDVDRNWLK